MTTITANVPLLGGTFEIRIEGRTIRSVTPSAAKTDLHAGPALFDTQVNGYAGKSCCGPARLGGGDGVLRHITQHFHRVGVGWWVPTVVTNSSEAILATFAQLVRELEADPELADSIPGLHLEGPYISPVDGPRGAHPLQHVRKPSWDEFRRMQEAAGGRIVYVTLAPEIEGALAFIEKCVESGVIVSVGHTALDRDTWTAAVKAGATLSTHLGNGAHNMIQRHNNHIWPQLADRATFSAFITDGQHLPDDCAYAMIHAKGLELSLITSDCVDLGGMPAGRYQFSGMEVEKLPSGRIVLLGTPNLAGSASHLLECTENVIRMARVSHAQGWALASTQAARALRLGDRLGISPGREATLTVYRYHETGPKIDVAQTWVAGRCVFRAA